MSEILSRIITNSCKLPAKDLKYADKFIKNRDWESLLEIVESDIIKHNRKRNADGLFDNVEDAELDVTYHDLVGDIISYIRLIEPDYKYENYDIDDSAYVGEDFDW